MPIPCSLSCRALMLACGLVLYACAQTSGSSAPQPNAPPTSNAQAAGLSGANGLRIYSTSIYSSYEVGTNPGLGTDGATLSAGTTLMIGWHDQTPRGLLEITYSGDFLEYLRPYRFNALSHQAGAHLMRTLTPTWTLAVNGNAQLTTTTEALFGPGPVITATSTPAGPKSPGPVFQPAGASTLLLDASGHALFAADRLLFSSVDATVTGRYSPRLTIGLLTQASLAESIDNRTAANGSGAMPPAYTGLAGVALGYQLTERTQAGMSISAARVWSGLASDYEGLISGSITRTFQPWLTAGVRAGGAEIISATVPGSRGTGLQYLAGASINVMGRSQTLSLNADRSVLSTYGLGAGTALTGTANWEWNRVASRWVLVAEGGAQRIDSLALNGLTIWRGSAGLSRKLGGGAAVTLSYVYLRSGASPSLPRTWTTQGVRLMLQWSPERQGI